MRIRNSNENNIKQGRTWLYLQNDKDICFEWNLRFNPFNFYLNIDGSEKEYTFSFWLIWVFYIRFSRIFNYYPKEWNSQTNNKQGGYLACAERRIGITQYDWFISLYLWHNGENSYYPDKDTKIYYKFVNLVDIFCGEWRYHTIEEFDTIEKLDLPEKKYDIDVQYRFWYKKWKRLYMKMFNYKGKSILIKSDIKYPIRKLEFDDIMESKDLERSMDKKWFLLKPEQTIKDAIDMYKEQIITKRSVESESWVPFEYRLKFERKQKILEIESKI